MALLPPLDNPTTQKVLTAMEFSTREFAPMRAYRSAAVAKAVKSN